MERLLSVACGSRAAVAPVGTHLVVKVSGTSLLASLAHAPFPLPAPHASHVSTVSLTAVSARGSQDDPKP